MNDGTEDMPIDADLDLLESYLDDALAPAESAALLVRLSTDTELAETLDALRDQRADRAVVWASLEPTDRMVDQLCWRVRGAVAAELAPPVVRRPRWGSFHIDPMRIARFTGAAAACVLLGFFGGRLGRGPTQSPMAVVTNNPSPSTPSGFTPVTPAGGGPVEVAFTDEWGRPVAKQNFQNADQARRFVESLQSHDGSPTQVNEGPVRTASELRY